MVKIFGVFGINDVNVLTLVFQEELMEYGEQVRCLDISNPSLYTLVPIHANYTAHVECAVQAKIKLIWGRFCEKGPNAQYVQ